MNPTNSKIQLEGKRVYVAGHNGLVGSALMRRLEGEGCDLLTASRVDLDLRQQASVETWMQKHRPQIIFMAAAKVGGIQANIDSPVEFLYDNLMIETNIIHAAHRAKVEKLVNLGSTCIYPKLAPQPLREEYLLTGALEPTNEGYAIAKIAGIKLCEAYGRQHDCNFISVLPTNLYGVGDNFDLTTSHVLPALMRKAHEAKQAKAKQLVVWGSGTPTREFLHVDDLAEALVFVAKQYHDRLPLNVGTGRELSIKHLAEMICEVVGYTGDLVFDKSKPDGTPRKVTDPSQLFNMGWQPTIDLRDGITQTYRWFQSHYS